ncbi:MAG: hypothetical protein J6Y92_07290 [Lentisphaeria bacterium]|nr:hypothetical protein [Lentisphaeria bacterium]
MYDTHTPRGIAPREIRDYTRVLREIDEERRELAAFAAIRTPSGDGFGVELTRHKDHLHDLTEQEELVMLRTRYVDFEPHWRAHRRFQRFLSTADSREELLFCTDWLRQHEATDDAEFRQWLRRGCVPLEKTDCLDCLYSVDPERILLSVKMQLI